MTSNKKTYILFDVNGISNCTIKSSKQKTLKLLKITLLFPLVTYKLTPTQKQVTILIEDRTRPLHVRKSQQFQDQLCKLPTLSNTASSSIVLINFPCPSYLSIFFQIMPLMNVSAFLSFENIEIWIYQMKFLLVFLIKILAKT